VSPILAFKLQNRISLAIGVSKPATLALIGFKIQKKVLAYIFFLNNRNIVKSLKS
jgi:hypothetical protein